MSGTREMAACSSGALARLVERARRVDEAVRCLFCCDVRLRGEVWRSCARRSGIRMPEERRRDLAPSRSLRTGVGSAGPPVVGGVLCALCAEATCRFGLCCRCASVLGVLTAGQNIRDAAQAAVQLNGRQQAVEPAAFAGDEVGVCTRPGRVRRRQRRHRRGVTSGCLSRAPAGTVPPRPPGRVGAEGPARACGRAPSASVGGALQLRWEPRRCRLASVAQKQIGCQLSYGPGYWPARRPRWSCHRPPLGQVACQHGLSIPGPLSTSPLGLEVLTLARQAPSTRQSCAEEHVAVLVVGVGAGVGREGGNIKHGRWERDAPMQARHPPTGSGPGSWCRPHLSGEPSLV